MIEPKDWPKNITLDALLDAGERRMFDLDNAGFCLACGHQQEGCEPDARRYKCESCGTHQVYGAEELLLRVAI